MVAHLLLGDASTVTGGKQQFVLGFWLMFCPQILGLSRTQPLKRITVHLSGNRFRLTPPCLLDCPFVSPASPDVLPCGSLLLDVQVFYNRLILFIIPGLQ